MRTTRSCRRSDLGGSTAPLRLMSPSSLHSAEQAIALHSRGSYDNHDTANNAAALQQFLSLSLTYRHCGYATCSLRHGRPMGQHRSLAVRLLVQIGHVYTLSNYQAKELPKFNSSGLDQCYSMTQFTVARTQNRHVCTPLWW